ncbi:MAG: hypothetical protein ACK559_05640, partial [bacterium]
IFCTMIHVHVQGNVVFLIVFLVGWGGGGNDYFSPFIRAEARNNLAPFLPFRPKKQVQHFW